jgi:hypothetical protein
MSDDDVRAKAVEAVREHLELSEKTRIKTSVRTSLGVMGSIILGTVAVCTYLNKISNSQDRMEASLNYKVSIHQFETWVSALDHQNRMTVPALVVPVVQPIKANGDE